MRIKTKLYIISVKIGVYWQKFYNRKTEQEIIKEYLPDKLEKIQHKIYLDNLGPLGRTLYKVLQVRKWNQ